MFSNSIYGSWQKIQKEKFKAIKGKLGPLASELFSGLVLDIGCGFGYLEKEFRGNFIGIDNDIGMLGSRVSVFPVVLGDAENLPFADEAFDMIVSVDTMHLIRSNDFLRVLKRGGFAMLTVFFNRENYNERRQMLLEKVSNMKVVLEFDILGRENEFVIVAVKG